MSTVYTVKRCEKIDLNSHNRTWEALPDMKEYRKGFNPCLFNEIVYLYGWGSTLMEAFSLQANRFIPLKLQLPEKLSNPCLYVFNNLLVVHSDEHITKFSAQKAGKLTQQSQIHCLVCVAKNSNSQPVMDFSQGVFFVLQRSQVLVIDMETGVKVRSFA